MGCPLACAACNWRWMRSVIVSKLQGTESILADEDTMRALILAGMAGDGAASRLFLTHASGMLRGFFRARLRGAPEDAEDLVQETLIALHSRRDSYDPSYRVLPWVYAIARHRLIDHVRRTKRRGIAIPVEDAPELLVESEAEASDARADVTMMLEQLPAKQRDAIRMVKLEAESVRDAAARLGISESDVKISIHRGLKKLTALFATGAAS
jgi:RNA polymerase sigma-70 factor, ECF subfamily